MFDVARQPPSGAVVIRQKDEPVIVSADQIRIQWFHDAEVGVRPGKIQKHFVRGACINSAWLRRGSDMVRQWLAGAGRRLNPQVITSDMYLNIQRQKPAIRAPARIGSEMVNMIIPENRIVPSPYVSNLHTVVVRLDTPIVV